MWFVNFFYWNVKFFINITHTGPNQLGKPLFKPDKPLKESQWKRLEQLRNDLDDEYDLRRQMLITRLDVTIQSFQVLYKVYCMKHHITVPFPFEISGRTKIKAKRIKSPLVILPIENI